MVFTSEAQKERSRDFVRRRTGDVVFPLKDIPMALLRAGVADRDLLQLGQSLAAGYQDVFPPGIMTHVNGEAAIRVSELRQPSMDTMRAVQEVSGGVRLLQLLDRDLSLSGNDSLELRRYKEKRREIGQEVCREMREDSMARVDLDFELGMEESGHNFETPELQEAYETLRQFAQDMMDKIFKSPGLNRFKPKVYITRSSDSNAFVFGSDTGQALEEYIKISQGSRASGDEVVELPIFLHRGLFLDCRNEDELAGILSHEFAHLLQPDYLGTADNDYRRRLEYDADSTAMHIADAAGYNPQGLVSFFKHFSTRNRFFIFGGSHPDTPNRIVELEKLYQSPEAIFPNGQKEMADKLPANILDTAVFISNFYSRQGRKLDSGRFSDDDYTRDDGKLESYLQSHQDPGLFLSPDIADNLEYRGSHRMQEDVVTQELAHGTLGYREMFLDELHAFLLRIKELDNKSEGLSFKERRITVNMYARNEYEEESLAILDTPKQEIYLREGTGLSDVSVNEKKKEEGKHLLHTLSRDQGIEWPEARATSLADWLDTENEYVERFWELVTERSSGVVDKQMTMQERLNYLHNALFEYMYGSRKGYSGSGPLFSVEGVKIEKWKRTVRRPKTSADRKETVLQNIPLLGRTQRRVQDVEYEEVEVEEEKTNPFTIFRIDKSNERSGHVKYRIWESPQAQPPIVREVEEIFEESIVSAYRQVLEEDGFSGDIPNEYLHYILRQIYTTDQSRHFDLPFAVATSVKEVHNIISIIESKSFANMFPGRDKTSMSSADDMNKPARSAFALGEFLVRILCFALKPQNEEEAQLQEEYMRRIEVRGGQYGDTAQNLDFYLGDPNEMPEDVRLNYKYVKIKDGYGDKKEAHLLVDDAVMAATNERVWADNEQRIRTIISTGKPLKNPGAPEKMRDFGLTPQDRQRIGKVAEDVMNVFGVNKRHVRKRGRMSKGLCEILSTYLGVARALEEYSYGEGALTTQALQKLHKDQHAGLLAPVREQIINLLAEQFPGSDLEKEDEDEDHWRDRAKLRERLDMVLKNMLVGTKDMSECIWEVQRVESLETAKSDRLAVLDKKVIFNHNSTPGIEARVLYRPHTSLPERRPGPIIGEYRGTETFELIIKYLETLGAANPTALKLRDILRRLEKFSDRQDDTYKSRALEYMCLGHLPSFSDFEKYLEKEDVVITKEDLEVMRAAGEVYGEEWKHLERYKALDQQLAYWEWKYHNPLTTAAVEYNHVRDRITGVERVGDIPLVDYLEKFDSELRRKYQVDRTTNTFLFSWPLLIQDAWETGDLMTERDIAIPGPREEVNRGLRVLHQELHRIVDDPDNLETIKQMQPGFFKEFFLSKKMEAAGVSTLEEIEEWLPHFSSYAHEASERNQIPMQVELKKRGMIKGEKEDIMAQAIVEAGYAKDVDDAKGNFIITPEADSYTLSDEQCGVRSNNYKIRDSDVDFEKIDAWYKELLFRAREEARQATLTQEKQVFLFSDHVVEDDRTRLEIGPVYRLQLVSQPLMDWHSAALQGVASSQEARDLYERVERDIPGRHPLKDIYIKNQMVTELWHILQEDLGDAKVAELGVSFDKTHVDLQELLKSFPLYADISFLQQYDVFELNGLLPAVGNMPGETAEKLIDVVEQALEHRISPDASPEIRAILLRLEEKVRLPQARKERESDEGVFEKYFDRIMHLYPEPSLERDEQLEKFVMVLAYTPEQIRRVSAEFYAERARWPEHKEKAATKNRFTAFEQVRKYVDQLGRVERVQYLIWLMGGREPIADQLSRKETTISLESRKQLFWQLSDTERRAILYELGLGTKGVFVTTIQNTGYYSHSQKKEHYSPANIPLLEIGPEMVEYIADEVFESMLGGQLIDDTKPAYDETNVRGHAMLKDIFRNLFLQQPEAADRAELMSRVMKGLGVVQSEGKEQMNAGRFIRTVLEQLGVVGIKAGQIMAEQPNLLPESVRRELSELKDSAAPFSKTATLTYMEAAGFVRGDSSACKEIKERLGSASIKQVHLANFDLDSDESREPAEDVVVKVKRPSIDKHFEKDIKVLRGVFGALEQAGYDIPSYLIEEIEMAIREELSFVHEAENQRIMKGSLSARKSGIRISMEDQELPAPVLVEDIIYPEEGQQDDIGVMVEGYAKGFSLKDLQKYKEALSQGDKEKMDKYRARAEQMYGASRVGEVEEKIKGLNLGRTQAHIGLELLRQIAQGGVFHSDMHAGNVYVDFTPCAKDAEVYEVQAKLIDLGSVGFTGAGPLPKYVEERAGPDYDAQADFRDFITGLVAGEFNPTNCYQRVAEVVNKYTGLSWNRDHIASFIGDAADTESRANKIFYAILKEGGGKNIHPQFRLLLKAIATGAGHLDSLRKEFTDEMGIMDEEETGGRFLFTREIINQEDPGKSLVNVEMIFS